jgi:hypothetical protein
VYYYNPYKKTYWGRFPTQRSGEPVYSLLKPEHRIPTLEEILEAAFPERGKTPPIPDSDDGALLDLPPDDLLELEPNRAALQLSTVVYIPSEHLLENPPRLPVFPFDARLVMETR